MDAMLISVVIPAYHSKKTIKKTISSICRELGSDILYEVIVVENGPEDGTRQVIEALAGHMPYIRLYHSVQGVSNARNEGMMHASGKWLMFVDADDELHPGSGKRLIEVMQTSEADVCLFGHQSGENGGRSAANQNSIPAVKLKRSEYGCWKHPHGICRSGRNFFEDSR